MAYGQIDPARLDGDALTRWYLRSPGDLEDERQAAAAQRYADFFGNTSRPSTGRDSTSAARPSTDLDDAQFGPTVRRPVGYGASFDDGVYHPDQDNVQKAPAAATAWSCPSCHIPLPLPPQLEPLAPLFRKIPPSWSGPAPEPRREKYPQCEMQERQDRGICAQQPTEPAKAVCNASATDRRVWCEEHQGEIGSPDLTTAWRKNGRRWP
jgi:hypothetical protein